MLNSKFIDKFNLSEEKLKSLQGYINFLLSYNNKINLIGKSTQDDIWNRHILDSLQIISYIDVDKRTADIGSGAGIPGIILSIAGVKNISLIEKSFRKCEFLEKGKDFSANKIDVLCENIYDIKNEGFDIIVSRALAPLEKLLYMCKDISHSKTKYVFLKGKKLPEEILNAKKTIDFQYQIFPSLTSSEGGVVVIENIVIKK